MRTPNQVDASRKNGKKSRGPVSREGKLKSSRNSLKHGVLALVHRPEWENPSLINDTIDSLKLAVDPRNDAEYQLIIRIATELVKQTRIDQFLSASSRLSMLQEDKEEALMRAEISALRRLKTDWIHNKELLQEWRDSREDILRYAESACTLMEQYSKLEEHPEIEMSATRRLKALVKELEDAHKLLKYERHWFSPGELHGLLTEIAGEQLFLIDQQIDALNDRLDTHRRLRKEMNDALPPEKSVKLALRYQKLIGRAVDDNLKVLGKLRELSTPSVSAGTSGT